MDADLLLMLLADARLPVAGHNQSGTVEAAITHGMTSAEVPSYLRTRLRSVTLVEAGTAVAARHASLERRRLLDVELAWAARTPSRALREASRGQGRALARLASRQWPEALEPLTPVPAPSRALVMGALAAHLRLEPAALARLVGYDDVQTVCAAVLKLAPLDPTDVVGWVADSLADISAMATEAARVTTPADIPAVGCPQIEVWAEAHAVTTRRLFRV